MDSQGYQILANQIFWVIMHLSAPQGDLIRRGIRPWGDMFWRGFFTPQGLNPRGVRFLA